nr:multiple epidermal growth factor-like domains protein 10 isoform X2 [Crassostrea gigas]
MFLTNTCIALWFSFSSAYENLALNKPAHEEYPYNNDVNTDASKAVDGLKTDLNGIGGQCSLSASNQRTSTWWVNLTSTRSIHDIRIYYRTDNVYWDAANGYTSRFLGFSIYVSNTTNKLEGKLCYKDRNFTRSTIPAVFNTTCFVHGQYVIYYNERLPGVIYPSGYSVYAYNNLCEVEVYGCPTPGYYGINCTTPCPDVNCGYCHIETGTCQGGCKPGYKGHQCELECDGNLYGENCSKSCGNCKHNQQCHYINGSCMNGCENGYQGLKCDKECNNGTYGNGCNKTCGHCVNKTICYHVNGTCFEGCDPGYRDSRCLRECTNNKYGDGCQTNCGHCLNMSQCHHINGTCFDGCDPGYEGQTCNQECQNRSYGYRCQRKCGHCLNSSKCDHVDGTCLKGCAEGYGGRTCNLVNLALRKPAYEENIYRHANVSAGNAVDGRKSNLNGLGGECSMSAEKQRTATWWVNLESIYSIHNIRIYHRTENVAWGPFNGHTTRFLGFSLYVANTTDKSEGKLCYKDRNFTRSTIPAVFNTTCSVHGQYVIYYNERLSGVTYPSGYSGYAYNELCEVEVYGCPRPGYYGIDCNLPCPDNCRYCHIETGTCQGCKPGYKGHQCELECDKGWYGDGCQRQCGHCINITQCNYVHGTCSQGCEVGYEGQTCDQECQDGYFGENCARECPAICHSCNKKSGLCDLGCHPGWKGTHCTEKCDGGLFGANCSTPCGHCLNNQQCHHLNGTCAKRCDPGYMGDSCTEECPDGYFGPNCRESCNETCKSCDKTSGVCKYGCKPGWKGDFCETICDNHFYGEWKCSVPCGKCLKNEQCHHLNGTCFNGCMSGFMGSKCIEECQDGYFGENCIRVCPIQCHSCNKSSGICDQGCHPGWKGTYCTEECDGGLYGVNCGMPCGHCLNNQQCHHLNGTCVTGCDPGYIGNTCTEACSNNTYGPLCSLTCGDCIDKQQCHHVTGKCPEGCAVGFQGEKCDKVQCTVQCLQPSAEPADHPSITYSVSALLAVCVIVIIFLTLRLCKHEQCYKCHQQKQPKDNKPVDTVPSTTGHDVNVDDGTAYQELTEVTNQPQRGDLGHTAVNPDTYVNVEGDNSAYQALGEVTQPSLYDTPFQK